MIRVLVVDDHAVVRRGVLQILRDEFADAELGEASGADEALQLTRTHPWDVVVMDMSMPGRTGLEALEELRREHPKLPVLMLSMHPEDQVATRLLRAGAAGYVTKTAAPDELAVAIRTVLQGGRYVSPHLAERLVLEIQAPGDRAPHERLSDREFQVLCMIARGRTVTEIGNELALSVKTVSTYRARILEKMELDNTAELIHYAVEHHLID